MKSRLPDMVSIEIEQIGRPRREMAAQLPRLPEWFSYFGAVARTREDTVPPFAGDYLNYTRRVPRELIALRTHFSAASRGSTTIIASIRPRRGAGSR